MYREYQQREDAIREETTKFNRVRREAKAEGRAEEKIESAEEYDLDQGSRIVNPPYITE